MVPMLDPMVPEATLLFAVTPAFVGVMTALGGAAVLAIVGALRELQHGERGHRIPPVRATHQDSSPLAA